MTDKPRRGRPRAAPPPDTYSARVGAVIRERRLRLGIDAIEISADLDIDISCWWRWEAGDREIPLNVLPAIAVALRSTVRGLIPEE